LISKAAASLAVFALISGSAEAFTCMLVSVEQRSSTTSDTCFGCHAGQLEKAPNIRDEHSHPSEVPYRGASGFRPVAELLPPVILVNGTVTCVSCHAPDSKELYRAALPPRKKLCLACHVKQ
jgi:hypothetical protein